MKYEQIMTILSCYRLPLLYILHRLHFPAFPHLSPPVRRICHRHLLWDEPRMRHCVSGWGQCEVLGLE